MNHFGEEYFRELPPTEYGCACYEPTAEPKSLIVYDYQGNQYRALVFDSAAERDWYLTNQQILNSLKP